jgi:aryl-alcohol dehydrogenase-like predicted oxidoreductase
VGVGEDVLVATKGGYGGAGQGRPEVLRAQIEQSLRSLRTEAIGLFYLHRVDSETPLEESLGAIKAYVDRRAIRHVGVSEVSVEQIERARRILPIAAVQNRYNLAERAHDDVVDFCERERIAFVPYFPLRGDGGPGVAAAAERLGVTEKTVKLAWLLRRSPVGPAHPRHALDRAPAREPCGARARAGRREGHRGLRAPAFTSSVADRA